MTIIRTGTTATTKLSIESDNSDSMDSPIPMPNDGKTYIWNEETTSWKELTEE